jgi:hypothetical protein
MIKNKLEGQELLLEKSGVGIVDGLMLERMLDCGRVMIKQPDKARDWTVKELHKQKTVNDFLIAHHYLGAGVWGWNFVLGAYFDNELIGLIILSHPAARYEDQKTTLEIRRLAFAPNAPKNSPSRLIGFAKRKAKKRGFKRIISYASTYQHHEGKVYLATGFQQTIISTGAHWKRKGRTKVTGWDTSPKLKFELCL